MADGLFYYEWYFNDWLGGGTRAEMSMEDRAIYRDLLDHQAASGSLPDDPQALANMALCSVGQARAFLERWGKLFPVGEDGRRCNARLAEVRSAILARLDKRSLAGQKGAASRWDGKRNGKRNAIAYANAMAYASDSESNSESESGSSEGGGGVGEGASPGTPHRLSARWAAHHLAAIYAAYPRQVKPNKAHAAIDRALCVIRDGPDPPEDPVMWLLGRVQAFAASPAGKSGYLQDPHNWFDDGRFHDDPSAWQDQRGAEATGSAASAPAARRRADKAGSEFAEDLRL